jgi:hypothetical protein
MVLDSMVDVQRRDIGVKSVSMYQLEALFFRGVIRPFKMGLAL